MSLNPHLTGQSPDAEELDHQRLTSLINSMADAVVAVDKFGEIVLYNGALLNILDVNIINSGTRIDSVLKPFDKNNQPADVMAIIESANVPVTNRDLRIRYSDGSYVNLYISVAPVHLGRAQIVDSGFVVLLRDITKEKSLEEERDEFISVVSHELRTPIAIAEGNISNAQYIADKSADIEAIKEALKEAHVQVLFLASMINDLSTLSRAERGKLTVEVESIDIKDLVKGLISAYQPDAVDKGLTIKSEVDPKLNKLCSSQLYVREILQNFITNAIKYSDKGDVLIKADLAEAGVRFTIKDNGIGISKADQERIYDKFFRSENYRTRQAKGTGLGLYVTMKLTRLIHAKIEVESELDKGSSFSIFIPDLA